MELGLDVLRFMVMRDEGSLLRIGILLDLEMVTC